MDRFQSEGAVKLRHQEAARATVGHAMVSEEIRLKQLNDTSKTLWQ
jgi:hypothetical protein